jgi:hypothetical protein
MVMPDIPKAQMDMALEEAWHSAEQTRRLLDENNVTTAIAWAASAQAWAAIAQVVATRLP